MRFNKQTRQKKLDSALSVNALSCLVERTLKKCNEGSNSTLSRTALSTVLLTVRTRVPVLAGPVEDAHQLVGYLLVDVEQLPEEDGTRAVGMSSSLHQFQCHEIFELSRVMNPSRGRDAARISELKESMKRAWSSLLGPAPVELSILFHRFLITKS